MSRANDSDSEYAPSNDGSEAEVENREYCDYDDTGALNEEGEIHSRKKAIIERQRSLSTFASERVLPEVPLRMQTIRLADIDTVPLVCHLVGEGILNFFKTIIGGERTHSAIKTLVHRVVDFCAYTWRVDDGGNIPSDLLIPWFLTVLSEKRPMLATYCEYLTTEGQYAPGTVAAHLDDISAAKHWLSVEKHELFRTYDMVDSESALIKLRAHYKSKQRLRSFHTRNIDALQRDNRWPDGGIEELQGIILARMPAIESTVDSLRGNDLNDGPWSLCTRSFYVMFLRVLLSGES
jgi:hypothetical protein